MPVQASTGTAECYNVIVKVFEDKITTSTAVIAKSEWSTVKALCGKERDVHETDLDEELRLLYQFIHEAAPPVENRSVLDPVNTEKKNKTETTKEKSQTVQAEPKTGIINPKTSIQQVHNLSPSMTRTLKEHLKAFIKVLKSPRQEQVKGLLEGTILVNMVDTGGQPAFLEMLPVLTMGPALYLIFFRLDQELKKTYQIQHVSKSKEGVQLGDSSYTVEEVIFQALSSISWFSCGSPKKAIMPKPSHAAVLIGTHKNLLGSDPEAEIEDTKLQKEVLVADLFKPGKKSLRYFSEDQLMFAVDNMKGNKELTKVHK